MKYGMKWFILQKRTSIELCGAHSCLYSFKLIFSRGSLSLLNAFTYHQCTIHSMLSLLCTLQRIDFSCVLYCVCPPSFATVWSVVTSISFVHFMKFFIQQLLGCLSLMWLVLSAQVEEL